MFIMTSHLIGKDVKLNTIKNSLNNTDKSLVVYISLAKVPTELGEGCKLFVTKINKKVKI